MKYILVNLLDESIEAYQEVCQGTFIRFTDMDGNTIGHSPCCRVLNDNPTQPTWALPDPLEPIVHTSKVISKLAYMDLFTDTELATIYTAAKSSIQLEVWLEKFKAVQEIDLSNAATISGLHALEAFGIIGSGRAEEIINA